jgi:NAD(P)-dependent dehydrogenase (short-subunit alcohol dehydrogenase family)
VSERVAFVTGAGSGIGRAAAAALAGRGLRVALADRDADAAERAAAEIGGDAIGLGCDIGVRAAVDAAVAEVLDRWGRLDVLANCAGIMHIAPAEDLREDDWNRVLSINASGAFRCCQAAFPALRDSPDAAIVNVTSISQSRGQPGLLAYAAAKGALESMTRTLAVEWAPHGIRVNAVSPGHTMTGMVEDALDSGDLPAAEVDRWRRRIPLRHELAAPGEIGSVIAFLASDGASYVSGESIVVDGALTINGQYD